MHMPSSHSLEHPIFPGNPSVSLYISLISQPGLDAQAFMCVPSFLIIDSSPPDVNVSTSLKLEDLYVKPEHRKKGAGKAFFRELGKIAREKVIPPSATFFFCFFFYHRFCHVELWTYGLVGPHGDYIFSTTNLIIHVE